MPEEKEKKNYIGSKEKLKYEGKVRLYLIFQTISSNGIEGYEEDIYFWIDDRKPARRNNS